MALSAKGPGITGGKGASVSVRWTVAVATLIAICPGLIRAHDIYSPLKDEFGGSCCDDQHCRPAPYRVTATGVQMLVAGAWIAVPRNKIQYRALAGDTGETGGGHWCGIIYDRVIGRVYLTVCAVLPPESAALQYPR